MPFLLWALIRLGGLERGWPLVQLLAFTPYGLAGALAAVPVALLLRRWAPAFLLAVAAGIFVVAVGPRGFGTPEEIGQGRPVRVLAANLHRGNADPRELLGLADSRDVDLLVLTELTKESLPGLEQAGIDRLYPNRVVEPRPRAAGTGVWSRWPLSGRELLKSRQAQIVTSVAVPDSIPFQLVAVHPMAPTGPRSTTEWNRDLGEIPQAGSRELPLVIAGDMNATVDHQRLRQLLDTGYRDAGAATGRGLSFTWPARLGWPPPVTIDHVLAERGIGFSDYDIESVPRTDHRAVYAELVLPPVHDPDAG